MTDALDLGFRSRLAGLAAAVPVDPPAALHATAATVVRRGTTSRRLAVGAFGPLLVVVVATVVASLAHVGPFAPAATANTPLVSAVRDGPFELAITSAKSPYVVGEPIEVMASLIFHGPDGSLTIAHGHGGPMAFGVLERIDGIFLTPAWRQSCEQSVLERDVPFTQPFAKSGSFSGDNPAASDAAGFFEDPTLELPAGTWHLYVVADFGVGDCGVDRHLMRADLEIAVAPAVVTNPPAPTAEPTRWPVEASTRLGDLELTIRSAKAVYEENEPINVSATLTYVGPDESVIVHETDQPTIVFGITPSPTGDDVLAFDPSLCIPRTLQRNVPITRSLVPPRFPDPALRASLGTWTIAATTTLHFAACAANAPALTTKLSIQIVAQGTEVPERAWLPTPPEADGTVQALGRNDGFELRIRASSKAQFTSNALFGLQTSYAYLGPEASQLIGSFPRRLPLPSNSSAYQSR